VGELADPVVIGTITAPHGVRGTVRVRSAGEGRHLREGLSPLVGGRRRRILRVRRTPKGFLLDLEDVTDRSRAAELRGEDLLLDRSELDAPEDEEFYVADLVGLSAVDERGERLGEVIQTFPTPAHEVLVVRGEGGLLYVPFIREHVPEVDLRAGRAVVRPPGE
jgi:16S rRNA processing protein RimM